MPLFLCTCNSKVRSWLPKKKRGTQNTIQLFQSVPHHVRSPEIPSFSQLQPETRRGYVQKSHPSELIPNILPQAGAGKAPIRVFKYPLTCIQTLKSPQELSLEGKLGKKRQDPELFHLLQKRLGTVRLAVSQSLQQENQSVERGCGFPSSFSYLETLLHAPLVECL